MKLSRKTPTGSLERRCEDAWRKFIIARDGKCRITGRTDNLEAAHIIPRSAALNTKFHPLNGVALTKWTHDHYTNNPRAWPICAVAIIGMDAYQDLEALARIKVYSPDEAWFEIQLDRLKGIGDTSNVT